MFFTFRLVLQKSTHADHTRSEEDNTVSTRIAVAVTAISNQVDFC